MALSFPRRRGVPALLLAAVVLTFGAAPASAQVGPEAPPEPVGPTAFDRPGMWIWYVSASHGGNLTRIIRRARRSGIGTVYIKSGDAGDPWSQFSRPLIRRLHRGGLKVCAWQFVYGEHPRAEARVAIGSIIKGADCFVIDAETHYEGRYAAADRYVRAIRRKVGRAYPISLASFPWVDYHPAFPYSVFMGPGAAQFNQPQMYWDAIGVTVREVYEHSMPVNAIYERPVYPIGQTYGAVSQREIQNFRRYAISFGGLAESWWSWQETSDRTWASLGRDITTGVPRYRARIQLPTLRRGDRGDMVVWAQQHLRGAGSRFTVSGLFGPKTKSAVRVFQADRGLPVTGVIDHRTWRKLLTVRPIRIAWSRRASSRAGVAGRRARASMPLAAPLSANLPARRNELETLPRR